MDLGTTKRKPILHCFVPTRWNPKYQRYTDLVIQGFLPHNLNHHLRSPKVGQPFELPRWFRTLMVRMDLCRCATCFVSLKIDMLQDEHVGNSQETGGNQRRRLHEANHRWFVCRERCWHRRGQADGYGWILIGGCLESFLYEKNHGYTHIRIK